MKLCKTAEVLVILAGIFLLMGFYPTETVAKERYEEKFEKTVDLVKNGNVILENISGDIEVKSWNKDQVKIDALKVSKASSLSQAKENAEKVFIEVNKEGNTLRIETKYPKKTLFKSMNVSVNYRLSIPNEASVKIKSVSGDITLEEIGGTVDVNAVSGDIDIRKVDKGVDCNTVSGDLDLQGVTGDAYLKTVSGDITLVQMRGSIEAETVSGEIEMREVSEAKVVDGKTISGEVVYQGSINPSGRYTLKSHSGDIEMILPSDSRFSLEARTFSGEIESDFDITTSGKISKRKIHGDVNGGGAVVKLSTFSGDVKLSKR